jgi:phenylacetate-CoA ligase
MSLYTQIGSKLLFPLHERLKGHDTVNILRRIEQSQWMQADQLEALQLSELRRMLEQVSASVPFYRSLFSSRQLTPQDFHSLDSLSSLPVIDKAVIRANEGEWCAAESGPLVRANTSGSSGEPLTFKLGMHRISFDIAAKWRATRWWGVDIGDREMVLWGSALETGTQDRIRDLRDRLLRSRLVPARDLNPEYIDRILSEMRAFRPRMLFGYPSALARIAFRAKERGLAMNDLGIRVAFCTSEVLRPEWREVIAGVFGCGVANEYGARDAGFIARECPHGGLHVTAEELIVEIVDESGERLPPGTEGDMVVTNLAGPEFPFIRYRTGDRGILSDKPCACGRGLPLIQSISGRANDGLIAADGGWVHGSAINHALREIDGLRAYRIIQESRQLVVILLALEKPLSDAATAKLLAHVRTLLGASVAVVIHHVDEIPPEANGKFRHIICHVQVPGPTPSASTHFQERA